jgi:hypothetical protein
MRFACSAKQASNLGYAWSINMPAKRSLPDANTKYLAAWAEVNVRIQARDNVFLAFISLTAVLVGIALSKEDLSFTAVGAGYVALATTLVIIHHEVAIGHLAEFQRQIVIENQVDTTTQWGDARNSVENCDSLTLITLRSFRC